MAASTTDTLDAVIHDDRGDLHAWCSSHDEAAFARIVARHTSMVSALCERQLGRGLDADEAAQAVFIVLARRAAVVRDAERLGSWLYGIALRVCQSSRRSTRRRSRHERKAAEVELPAPAEGSEPDWSHVRPHLDEAMAALSTPQREAVICRLLQGLSYVESAQRLGISEDAVRKRVDYGVGRLRSWFLRRGLGMSAAALVAGLTSEAHAADAGAVTACTAAARDQGRSAALADAVIGGRSWLRLVAAVVCIVAVIALLAWVVARREPEATPPTPSATQRQDPWLQADLSACIAAFAAADAAGGDTLGLHRHLGVRWRDARPRLRIDVAQHSDPPTAQAALAGAGPMSPLPLVYGLLGSDGVLVASAESLRPLDNRAIPAPLPREFLRLSVACTPSRIAALSTQLSDAFPFALSQVVASMDLLPDILARMRDDPAQRVAADCWELDTLAMALRDQSAADVIMSQHWSGDATVLASPDPRGYAACSLVFGLRQPIPHQLLRAAIPAFVQLQPVATPGPGSQVWRTWLLGRPWMLALTPERMVLSELSDVSLLLSGSLGDDDRPGDAAIAWMVDLPTIAGLDGQGVGWSGVLGEWWPRMPAMLTALRDGSSADLPAWLDIDGTNRPHLPLQRSRWRGSWSVTGDGFRAEESGPSILATALAAGASIVAGADAKALVAEQRERSAIAAAHVRHFRTLQALRLAFAHLLRQQPVPARICDDLAPLFQGTAPGQSALQDRLLHTTIPQPQRRRVRITRAAVVPPSYRNLPKLFELDGEAQWRIALDAEWSAVAIDDAQRSDSRVKAQGAAWTLETHRMVGIVRTRHLDAIDVPQAPAAVLVDSQPK